MSEGDAEPPGEHLWHAQPTVFLQRQGATLVAVAVAFVGSLGMAEAQPVTRHFDRNAPAIGDAMPDVVVYDQDGEELPLRDLLSEHYSVLILGCLT